MTQQEHAEVLQRRDALLAQLNYVTDDDEAKLIKTQIEACNQELMSATSNPPNENSDVD